MISIRVMAYHLKVWKICGIWSNSVTQQQNTIAESNKTFAQCYPIYSITILSLVFGIFPACMLMNLLFLNSLNEIVENLMICSTCVLASVKGAFVFVNRSKLIRLFKILNEMDHSLYSDQDKTIVHKTLKESKRLVYYFSFLYYCGVNSAFLLALTSKNPTQLMWPSWYPFINYESNITVYYVILIYQYVSTMIIATLDASVDLYGSALNKILGAHLDVLGMKLRQLGFSDDVQPDKILPNHENNLHKCVKYHNLCIKFSKSLDDILSYHYLVQFGSSGLIICASAFQLSVMQPMSELSKFSFVCEYIFSMCIQIFVPCYFGSIVTYKSEQLLKHIYNSNWIEQSKQFRMSMRIFTQRSLRPIVPFAGRIFVIGLPTFVTILRAAYSLLSVLKNFETER